MHAALGGTVLLFRGFWSSPLSGPFRQFGCYHLSGHGSLRGRQTPPHDGVGSLSLAMLHTRSICSLRFRFQAATVPTRWLLPRPDKGHRTARSGGSLWVSVSCGLPFLARPPEVRVVTPHPVQDHRQLTRERDGRLLAAHLPGEPGAPGLQRPIGDQFAHAVHVRARGP